MESLLIKLLSGGVVPTAHVVVEEEDQGVDVAYQLFTYTDVDVAVVGGRIAVLKLVRLKICNLRVGLLSGAGGEEKGEQKADCRHIKFSDFSHRSYPFYGYYVNLRNLADVDNSVSFVNNFFRMLKRFCRKTAPAKGF